MTLSDADTVCRVHPSLMTNRELLAALRGYADQGIDLCMALSEDMTSSLDSRFRNVSLLLAVLYGRWQRWHSPNFAGDIDQIHPDIIPAFVGKGKCAPGTVAVQLFLTPKN